MPALFLVVTFYLLVNTMLATPIRAIAGIGLIVVGLPIYEYFTRRGDALPEPNWLGDET